MVRAPYVTGPLQRATLSPFTPLEMELTMADPMTNLTRVHVEGGDGKCVSCGVAMTPDRRGRACVSPADLARAALPDPPPRPVTEDALRGHVQHALELLRTSKTDPDAWATQDRASVTALYAFADGRTVLGAPTFGPPRVLADPSPIDPFRKAALDKAVSQHEYGTSDEAIVATAKAFEAYLRGSSS